MGDVQGVGYRYFAMRAASRHDISGTVRNLEDGSVEVIAEGTREDMDEFKNELATGPIHSSISSVSEVDLQPTGRFRDFRIEH
jgi:acylphosphatase